MNEIERAKVKDLKAIVEMDGYAKARQLVLENKRDGDALTEAMKELAEESEEVENR